MDFLTPEAKKTFIYLQKAFTKTPILRHFDSQRHIQIETHASGYAIDGVLSQMTSDQCLSNHVTYEDTDSFISKIGQWHLITFFSRKIIPTETRYETHNHELLAIIEAFKTWHHYLEGCTYEVLVLTNYNNLRQFMNTKSLSSKKVR